MGIHGLHRPREWDTVALVAAPGLTGDHAVFVVLRDGSLVAEAGADPARLAAAVSLAPPYRAEAVRRSGASWAVAARTIEVVELAAPPSGDEIEVVWGASGRRVEVDGEPTLVSFPELERLGSGRFDAWVVRARRLQGAAWEVDVQPL